MASAYTEEQIDRYLDYISIPPQYHRKANHPRDLKFLHALHTHQLSTIPYENLSLHYSKDHKICLDPQRLYKKLTINGRGGYCMEDSIFFNHVLRALGFQVYTAGVRIKPRINGVPQGDYMGWVHVVNIVTLDNGSKYMIDVSFGGDGATKPLPLVHGAITQNIGTQELRLVYDNIPEQVDTSRKLWIYQYRNGKDLPWNSFYCFPELEFTQQDFEVMNYFASSSPASFQTYTVLIIKFLRRDDEIYGKVMLVNGEVKQNTGGRTSLVKACKTEEERIEALKEYFGIALTDEEKKGILGTVAELSIA